MQHLDTVQVVYAIEDSFPQENGIETRSDPNLPRGDPPRYLSQ